MSWSARVASGFSALLVLVSALFAIERTAPQNDGAQYWAMADRLAEFGGGFYVGAVDHKGPLWVGAFRLARSITGNQAWYWFVIAAEAIALALIVGICTWWLARRVVGHRPAVTIVTASIVVLMLLGPEAYSQSLFGRDITSAMASVAVVSLVLSLRAARGRSLLLVVVAGLLMGLATQTVLTTGAPTLLLAVAVWFVDTDRRRGASRAIVYLVAAAVAFASAPVWYWLQGSSADFRRYFWDYNMVYGSSSLVGRLKNAIVAIANLGFTSGYWVVAGAAAVFAVWHLWNTRHVWLASGAGSPNRVAMIVTAWWFGELASVMGPDRYFGHYWSLMLAPSAVLAVLMWSHVFDRFATSNSERSMAMAQHLGGTAAFRHARAVHHMPLRMKLLLLPLLLIALQSLPAMVDGIRTASTFRSAETHLAHDRENVPSSVAALRPIANMVTGADESFFAWTPVAEVFVVVDRPSATRFDRRNWLTGVVYGSEVVVPWPHLETDLLADLKASKPRLVVEVLDDPFAPGTALHDYIAKNYRPIYESSATFPVRVYAPRDLGGTTASRVGPPIENLAAVDQDVCRAIVRPGPGATVTINVHGYRQQGTFTIMGSSVVADRGPIRYADVDDDRAVTTIPDAVDRLTVEVAETSALLWAGDMIVGALDLPGGTSDVTFEGVTPTSC